LSRGAPAWPYTTLFRSAGLEGLDQLDPPAALLRTLLQRQSEARADQTTADDRQLAHDQATSRAPAISASISATALGTPLVRISRSEEHTSELQSRENLV